MLEPVVVHYFLDIALESLYIDGMQDVLNDISKDIAFVKAFNAQMAYYRHMCRVSDLLTKQPSLASLYAPNVLDALVRWEDLGAMTGVPDSHETKFLLDVAMA